MLTAADYLFYAIGHDSRMADAIGDRLFASTSLGEDGTIDGAKVETPWAAWNELPAVTHEAVRKVSKAKTRTYQLFVYDDPGVYSAINHLLEVAEDVVQGFAPKLTTAGIIIMESMWEGLSGNLRDESYGCAVRFGTASLVVSS